MADKGSDLSAHDRPLCGYAAFNLIWAPVSPSVIRRQNVTEFGPCSGSVPRNPMNCFDFPVPHTNFSAQQVRDRFGRFGQSKGPRENRLPFFRFLDNRREDRGTHNPSVVGSNPTRPTNSIDINGLWRHDRGAMVSWWVPGSPRLHDGRRPWSLPPCPPGRGGGTAGTVKGCPTTHTGPSGKKCRRPLFDRSRHSAAP